MSQSPQPPAADLATSAEHPQRPREIGMLAFLHKQRGLRSLLGRASVTPDAVYDAQEPRLGERELTIAGFHYYTFNQLLETWRWECRKTDRPALCEEVVTT